MMNIVIAAMFPTDVGKIHLDFGSIEKCSLQAKRVLLCGLSSAVEVPCRVIPSLNRVRASCQDTSCHMTSKPCYVIVTV